MKKVLIIAAAALFIGSTASAQDVMKQTGGEQNLEFLFSPLGGSPIGINGIKYRKFTSATTASTALSMAYEGVTAVMYFYRCAGNARQWLYSTRNQSTQTEQLYGHSGNPYGTFGFQNIDC